MIIYYSSINIYNKLQVMISWNEDNTLDELIEEKEKTEVKAEVIEELKEKILEKEDEKTYFSEKFKKIEDDVKESLRKQATDDALKDITWWSMILWSSDIHYECYENYVVVRFRIDWILVEIFRLTKIEYKPIVERIKYASNLKLNISNIPQDWKYSMMIEWAKINVRISTLPIKYWENIVSRILDSRKSIVDFEKLGFFWMSKRMIEKAISKKSGMILVTWPTGSGKTTTLYTILAKLNEPSKKIITLEDPIEYELEWVVQSEVSEKDGFSFKTWLKALLRQDPDVIMIWEIRDKETLYVWVQASLTWHLVLSTLHTKSAAETLDRIINMWLQPYVLASAIDIIIAQRLVRKICSECRVEREKTSLDTQIIEVMMKEIWMERIPSKFIKLYEWKWCTECNNSWYSWRVWIYEIISFSENLRNLIREWATTEEIILEARKWDLVIMREDGILKAIKGFTTIEEILRVV